jgi:hypothetical protein
MALPELDMNDDLEADTEQPGDPDLADENTEDPSEDVDPMFAADMQDTGLDLDDKQLAALQRAILGVMSNMGGMSGSGGGQPPAMPF